MALHPLVHLMLCLSLIAVSSPFHKPQNWYLSWFCPSSFLAATLLVMEPCGVELQPVESILGPGLVPCLTYGAQSLNFKVVIPG